MQKRQFMPIQPAKAAVLIFEAMIAASPQEQGMDKRLIRFALCQSEKLLCERHGKEYGDESRDWLKKMDAEGEFPKGYYELKGMYETASQQGSIPDAQEIDLVAFTEWYCSASGSAASIPTQVEQDRSKRDFWPTNDEGEHICMACSALMGKDYEPPMCCSGAGCGCMGKPTEPNICSEPCWDKIFHPDNRDSGNPSNGVLVDRGPHLEYWAPIHDGKLTAHREECSVGMINGIEQGVIFGAEDDLFESLEALLEGKEIPEKAFGVSVIVSNFCHEDGQMTFPETGQWDFPPYWEMDMKIKGFDVTTDGSVAFVEALLQRGNDE